MNFTLEIKNELLKHSFDNTCCKIALLSAFIRLSGSIRVKNNFVGFEVVTESENCAEYFINLLEEIYGVEVIISDIKKDKLSKKDKITFECINEKSRSILEDLGIIEKNERDIILNINLNKYILENECCRLAYIIGAFLGGGSCTIPLAKKTLQEEAKNKATGYHLEFVFTNYVTASGFLKLLEEKMILSKLTARKGIFIVYIKSSECISDILALMGASNAALKLTDVIVRKDYKNNINRQVNCSIGNLIKQMDASVKQVRAIKKLQDNGILITLSYELQTIAKERLNNENLTLSELAEKLKISKSCLNHRLRKIIDISNKGE